MSGRWQDDAGVKATRQRMREQMQQYGWPVNAIIQNDQFDDLLDDVVDAAVASCSRGEPAREQVIKAIGDADAGYTQITREFGTHGLKSRHEYQADHVLDLFAASRAPVEEGTKDVR